MATRARLRSPRDVAVRETDGSVFIADGGNHRVRRIDPDGTIETVAGDGQDAYNGDGGLATAAGLDTPSAVLPLRDGGVLIADAGHASLRKVASEGTIATVAGNGTPGFRGDGGPAAQARIDFPQAIVLGADDTIYVADVGNDRVRALAPSLPGLSLGEFTIASEDGRSLYVFDRSGRHLRTLDALTKAEQLRFGYDPRGRLIWIEDGDGRRTTIQRDASGHADGDRRPVRPDHRAAGVRGRLPEPDREPGRRPDPARVRRRRPADAAAPTRATASTASTTTRSVA